MTSTGYDAPARSPTPSPASHPTRPKPLSSLGEFRGHWGIENRLHWIRDVTYDEDRSQARTGTIPRVIVSVRNLAISTLRLAGATNIASTTRWPARNSHRTLPLTGQ
jgi:hypothetical protein